MVKRHQIALLFQHQPLSGPSRAKAKERVEKLLEQFAETLVPFSTHLPQKNLVNQEVDQTETRHQDELLESE
jgi:hypothetical protein